MLIEYMERCRVDTERTGRTFALVCAWIWSCYSCLLSKYNTTSMMVFLRLWWRNAVMLTLDEQLVSLYWSVFEFEDVIRVRGSSYEVVMAPWRAVQMHYNVDGGSAFLFVKKTVSGWTWTSRRWVCISVCLNLKLVSVFDPVWGHDRALVCSQ